MATENESSHTVSDWLEQVKFGDEQAFEQLWKHYYLRLTGMARSTVSRSPARSADEDDVVQSALTSFYFRAKEGRYPDLHDRTGLWKLLITITLSKARALSRKEIRRRQLIDERADDYLGQDEPSPAFAAELADQFQQLMERLHDQQLQQIAVAKLEGYSNEEIAVQVGKSIPTVERKLRLIRELWSPGPLSAENA